MTAEHRRPVLLLLGSVLLVAANLRASITSVGPVLVQISAATGLGSAALGLLGAVPLLAFAVVSPLVHLMSRRLGTEKSVLIALVVLAAATVLRSVPGPGPWSVVPLWVGTALIGASIAVGNVLVPALIKRDFSDRIAFATGLYSAVLSGFAGLASGVAVPIAHAFGWRVAIGCWAVPTVIAAVAWLPRLADPAGPAGGSRAPAAAGPAPSLWRSATAWQVALFMGAQSTSFYTLVTWLPTIEAEIGVSPLAAGAHLFAYQIIQIVAGPLIGILLRGRADLRLACLAAGLLMVIAMTGLAAAPGLVWVWIFVAGASSGAGLVLALTLVAQRARTMAAAAQLSGMAQGVGYLIAALGPVALGVLLGATGDWVVAVLAVGVVGLCQAIVGLLAGRDRYAG